MTYNQIRKSFLDYFKAKGHEIVPSASLIPDDKTLLFTVAGMVPFKAILQGTQKPFAARVADCQKCIRAGGKHNDLEDVGFDGRHHTFFEMLGNWSFGDYFKQEAIEMSWELLTKVFGLDPQRIVVTTHTSDDEATEIWKKVANKDAIRLGDKSNWWSAGDTGPCGPCSEMFYDMGGHLPGGLPGSENEDEGRFVEIWNDVFMQFNRDADGNLTPLPSKNVDTGAGLERVASVLQGVTDNYDTDLFIALKKAVSDLTGAKETPENRASFKVITDHLRCVGFAIADGVVPSNTERGYVVRRILRRAMRHGQVLGYNGPLLSKLYPALVAEMGEWYPELAREQARVIETMEKEERAFEILLRDGLKLLDKEVLKINDNTMPGETAFKLYDTYGFPLDLTQSILRERGIGVDTAGFDKAMTEQKERSRTAGTFKGGLADDSQETTRLHTAAHLLHGALRKVLGETVFQKGSNITPERLRFDFSFDRKMTAEEIAEAEKIVNEAIAKKIPVTCEEFSLEAAKSSGAVGVFDAKYGDKVKVFDIAGYDKEICGGPHVSNTGELGTFKIQKEESSAAGVRRIKAVLG